MVGPSRTGPRQPVARPSKRRTYPQYCEHATEQKRESAAVGEEVGIGIVFKYVIEM